MIFRKRHRLAFWMLLGLFFVLVAVPVITPAGFDNDSPLMINEFLAANGDALADEDGDYSDWIEIYNRSRRPVNLAGWSLTDDLTRPDKWLFGEQVLQPDDYLLVFASGKDRNNHTNFKLSRTGGVLALNRPDSRRYLDAAPVAYPPQERDIAYGYDFGGAQYGYLPHPTPGAENDSLIRAGVAAPVEASRPHGLYSEPFALTLTTLSPEASIYYTTDGSRPGPENGLLYNRPIQIDGTTVLRAAAHHPALLPAAADTYSYIFIEDVLSQPPNPPGYPNTWGTHSRDTVMHATGETFTLGEPALADYEMDPRIVNDPLSQDLLREGLADIPSLSLVMDRQDFLTLYANPTQRGRAWERPVSVEWFDPQQPQAGFQIDAGLRIQGSSGRFEYVPKHSFRLFFRDEYGLPMLDHPLFPDSPVTQFDTLVLRGGVNRSFAGNKDSEPDTAAYTRDEWARASQIAISGVGSHGTFAHLYINGLYWGLYNLVERPDADFGASYFGGPRESWHGHNHSGPISGDPARLFALADLMLAHEHGGFGDPATYAAAQALLDMEDFVDYVILNWYAGNQDWPTSNWYATVRNPDGKIRFFEWDAEHTWTKGALLYFELEDMGNLIGRLFMALWHNPDFRITFADRVYRLLYHDGPLTEAQAMERWRSLNAPLGKAIVAESARWGDAHLDPPVRRARWLQEQDKVLAQMRGNVDKLIGLLRTAERYPSFDPPEFSQRGGLVPDRFALAMQAESGDIYYTTDGTDPRQAISGEIAPSAQRYDGSLPIHQNTQVKARVRLGQTWSALNQATFWRQPPLTRLSVSEIMYNPPGGEGYEFIELQNTGSTDLDLSRARFEGIQFTMPTDTVLVPGQYYLLARNPDAFVERYPGVRLDGLYRGKLSNKGEPIRLRDANGSLLLEVAYNDEAGWPLSPDGRGDSLVLIDPEGDPNDPQNWRASQNRFGSPGQADE